jgi:hypothetical protein
MFLMLSGCCKKDVEVKLSDDGRWVTVWVNIPETFLEPSRGDVQGRKRLMESTATKPAALRAAVDNLRSKAENKDGRVAFPFKFKLPVACRPVLVCDPLIGIYPNDWVGQRKERNHCKILHIDLLSTYEQPNYNLTVKLKESNRPMPSPIVATLDTDSDDDSNDQGMSGAENFSS